MVAWKCTWVENSLGCLVCTHISVLVSLRAQKVIMEIMGKGVCQTLSRAGFGLKISNQPEPSNYIKTRTVCRTSGWCKAKGMWAQQPAWSHRYTLFVSLCSDLLNKYISFKIVALHHRSALGHRDKCGMCSGLLEADKTSFVFFLPPAFEVLACLIWLVRMASATNRLAPGQCTRGRSHMGTDRWKVPVPCLWQQRSQISALMAAPHRQHLPHPANLLAFLQWRESPAPLLLLAEACYRY